MTIDRAATTYMRFAVALMLQQQPADGLLLSAETTCYLYDIRCTIYYLA